MNMNMNIRTMVLGNFLYLNFPGPFHFPQSKSYFPEPLSKNPRRDGFAIL